MPRNGLGGRPLMINNRYWRKRAERLRRIADETIDPDSRRVMLELADSYERLAQRADERAEEDQLLGR